MGRVRRGRWDGGRGESVAEAEATEEVVDVADETLLNRDVRVARPHLPAAIPRATLLRLRRTQRER
jgi:hypothetical protein